MNTNKNANKSRGPGRPRAVIVVPRGKFTFADLVEANASVIPLTLRKFINREMFTVGKGGKSVARRNAGIALLDETRKPDNKDGLGRRQMVYQRVAGATLVQDALATAPVAKTAKTPAKVKGATKGKRKGANVSVSLGKTSEAKELVSQAQAILAAPTPAPVPETAPVAEVPAAV